MPRVKRGTVRRAKRKKLLARAKGFYQTKSKLYRAAKESVDTALQVRLRRPQEQEARLPAALGRPHQRGGARERPDLLAADARTQGRGHRRSTARCWPTLAVTQPAAFAKVAAQAKAALPAAEANA